VYQTCNNDRKKYDFASIFISCRGARRSRSPLPKATNSVSRFAAIRHAATPQLEICAIGESPPGTRTATASIVWPRPIRGCRDRDGTRSVARTDRARPDETHRDPDLTIHVPARAGASACAGAQPHLSEWTTSKRRLLKFRTMDFLFSFRTRPRSITTPPTLDLTCC